MPRLIMSVVIRTSNLRTCRFAKSYTVLQVFRCAMGLKIAVAKPRNKQPRRSLHKSIKERNNTVGNTQTTCGNTHNLSCASLSLSLSLSYHYCIWSKLFRSSFPHFSTQRFALASFGLQEDWRAFLVQGMTFLCSFKMGTSKHNIYFTSCDPHHDIYRFSYWQILWHSI